MKPKKPISHIPMSQFKSLDGELLVNGKKLSELKGKAGKRAFYAYDRSIMTHKINSFRQSMPAELKLHYAIKANPMPELVNFIAAQVDGLDVASGNELEVALKSNISNRHISFAGPGKQIEELEKAINAEITINIESLTELERINHICQQTGITAKVAIRVNPDFELKASGMKMGGGAQQFGIDAEQIPMIAKKIESFGLDYQGLHIFTGSQNLNADSIIQAHTSIFELATRLQRQFKQPIHSLNIGGGLGIPYFPGEKPLSLESIGEALKPHLESFQKEFGETHIAMELGRYLVGDSGIYVAEITDVKISRGTTFAIINGGLHHHLSASGNFGQVIRKNYPVSIGNKLDESELLPIQIVGSLCTPLDLMAHKYPLPNPEIGDLVVIYQSGAYGYTASPINFLSHPHPLEMLV